jgi:phage terminase large subunit GpA-like protein
MCDPEAVIRGIQRRILPPPPVLTLSEWADRERILGPEESSEPGRWKTARVPYLKGPLDAVSDPSVRTVVMMCSARVGKTELINNAVGYFVDQDPSPMLIVHPTIGDAKSWSKEKLAPMILNTPAVRAKIKDARTRESGNEIQRKVFPGGYLFMTGGNSASGLKSRTTRVVIFDEVENIAREAGEFGDPIELAKTRTTTYPGRYKHLLVSTPGNREGSAIESAFTQGTMARYEVPCPHCGALDHLRWAQMKWEGDDIAGAVYICPHCQEAITDADKKAMLAAGQWVPQKVGKPGVVSFHLNALYNPWIPFADLVKVFLEKSAKGPAGLKTFVNEYLGETWNDRMREEEKVDGFMKRARDSHYLSGEVPAGVGLLVAGIDIQGDRAEVVIRGIGTRGTRWTIAHHVIGGNPMMMDLWDRLQSLLDAKWQTQNGHEMRIRKICIDEGFHSKHVKAFIHRPSLRGRIAMVKGASWRQAKWCIPAKRVKGLYTIDTVSIKDVVYDSLRIDDPEVAGYQWFPRDASQDFFDQLLSNKRNPRTHRYEPISDGAHEEALDCTVYCEAAVELFGLRRGEIEELVAFYARTPGAAAPPAPPKPVSNPTPKPSVDVKEMLMRQKRNPHSVPSPEKPVLQEETTPEPPAAETQEPPRRPRCPPRKYPKAFLRLPRPKKPLIGW